MVKKLSVFFIVVFLIFAGFSNISVAYTSFIDVPDTHWAKTAIYDLVDRGIAAGIGNNKFGTNDSVTRAQFCKFIVQATGKTLIEWKGTFSDVPTGKWYSGWVEAAAENGYMSGKGAGRFEPDGKITRQEMAVALANVISIETQKPVQELGSSTSLTFTDNQSMSSWALPGIKAVVKFELMKGSNNLFKPKANAIRAEAAMIIYSTIKSGILNDSSTTSTSTPIITTTAQITSSPEPTLLPTLLLTATPIPTVIVPTITPTPPPTPALLPPNNFWGMATSSTTAVLGWDKNEIANYYYIYNGSDIYGPYSWVSGYCVSITGLTPGETVYYAVVSEKDGNYSELSEIISVTLPTATPQPTDPNIAYPLKLYSDETNRKFLGNCVSSEFAYEGIFNEFSTYGSEFGSYSVWNEFGTYGSEFSSYSAFNKFSTHPPLIIDSDGYIVGRLTVNEFVVGAISPYDFKSLLINLGQ